jgi:hypothetical protein
MIKYGKIFANLCVDDRVVIMSGKPIRSSLRKKAGISVGWRLHRSLNSNGTTPGLGGLNMVIPAASGWR